MIPNHPKYTQVLVILVTVLLPVVSPCCALLRDIHETHVRVLGGPVVMATLLVDAGQSGLLHGGLLPQQGASGGGAGSPGSATRSGAWG